MQSYLIYPVKEKEAQEYLLMLGCSVDPGRLNIPDHFQVKPSNGTTYAVTRRGETVLCIQHYPSNRWRIVVPVSHRLSFAQLLRVYHIDEQATERALGNARMLDLLRDVPVQRPIAVAALKWLSDYTGYPYDLENVPVALSD